MLRPLYCSKTAPTRAHRAHPARAELEIGRFGPSGGRGRGGTGPKTAPTYRAHLAALRPASPRRGRCIGVANDHMACGRVEVLGMRSDAPETVALRIRG